MARIVFTISNLTRPLSRLQELYTVIPPGRMLSIRGASRIAFFLGDSVELLRSDGHSMAIVKGDALIAPGDVHYRLRGPQKNLKSRNHVLVITFDEITLKDPGRTAGEADFGEVFSQGLRLAPGALNQGCARAILHLIRHEADQSERPNPLLMSGLCTALVAGLMKRREEGSPGTASPKAKGRAAVEHARQYMRQFCHEKLTLSQIAWEVQLSGEHLARLFRLHTGGTVFDYLDEIRIEKVRGLLQTTDLPVVHIAPLCGFPSSALLGRHLRAKTGKSPQAYRLAVRNHESFRPSLIESPPQPSRARSR